MRAARAEAPPHDAGPAAGVRWDLSDLYPDTASLEASLERDEKEAAAFAGRYRGRVAAVAGDPAAFAAMMRELEALSDSLGRAYTYAYLHWSTDTEDPGRGALLQKVREAYTRAGQDLLFVDVEWAALDDAPADALLASPQAAGFRHHLVKPVDMAAVRAVLAAVSTSSARS